MGIIWSKAKGIYNKYDKQDTNNIEKIFSFHQHPDNGYDATVYQLKSLSLAYFFQQ